MTAISAWPVSSDGCATLPLESSGIQLKKMIINCNWVWMKLGPECNSTNCH